MLGLPAELRYHENKWSHLFQLGLGLRRRVETL